MNKIKNTKGFTLMEMLIVVAIIAVLVAIAIPTFTTSLNKARIATDEANIRSGYASVMADILTKKFNVESGTETNVTYYLNKDGSVSENAATDAYACYGNQTTQTQIAGLKDKITWAPGSTVSYQYTKATSDDVAPTVTIVITPKAGG